MFIYFDAITIYKNFSLSYVLDDKLVIFGWRKVLLGKIIGSCYYSLGLLSNVVCILRIQV